MKRVFLTCLAAAFMLSLIPVTTASAADEAHSYVGTASCKMCHKKEATGDQYGKWLESAHAKAFEVLASDEAKAAAAKAGLKGNPQELGECLVCHTTAHGVDASLIGKRMTQEEGVGCEACHGPGSDYKSKKVMEDLAAAKAAGMVVPTAETCTKCHNDKSPTFKGFDFAEYSKKIAHPNPAKGK